MKSLLTIKLMSGCQLSVKKGKKVSPGDVLAFKKKSFIKEKLPLSVILSVKPAHITKYLSVRIGSMVNKGEILAKKESLFNKTAVFSPISGIIDSIDIKEGVVYIMSQSDNDHNEISPINGIIEGVNDEEITISFNGRVVEGVKGQGNQVRGKAHYYHNDLDVSGFASEVIDKIIIGPSFSDAARAKLKTLGARGLIANEFYSDFPNSLSLNEKQMKDIFTLKADWIILLGQSGKIIIPVE
jgi:hypothetical protein